MPLSTNDIIKILESKTSYKELLPKFYKALNHSQDFGSKWYKENVSQIIKNL